MYQRLGAIAAIALLVLCTFNRASGRNGNPPKNFDPGSIGGPSRTGGQGTRFF